MRNTGFLGLALMLGTMVSVAQIQFGEIHLSGTGAINGGYNASYGDQISSNHSFLAGGEGNFNGYYYNPRFIAFDVRPYYNQSRANSTSNSIFSSSGINASAQIFGGSHFPGTVGFSEANNDRSVFGLANGPELTTNGKGHGFNIAWSELLPGLPTLTAAYSQGVGSGTVLGTTERSSNDNKTFNLRSTYTFAGFRFNGMYQRSDLQSKTPGFLVGTPEIDSSGKTDVLGLQVNHKFPFHGNVYGNVTQTHFQTFFEGVDQGKTTVDTFDGGVFMIPTKKTSLGFSGSYSNNIYGVLHQAVATNGNAALVPFGTGTHTYTMSVNGGYAILDGLYAAANLTHVGQVYFGQAHQNTYFTGTLSGVYRRPLFGMLNWSVSMIDNATQEGNSNIGLSTSVNASRRFYQYEIGGDFGYQQNVQTLLVGYTESDYRWSAHVNRRAEHWYWSGGVGGGHSLLTSQSGAGNHAENAFGTIGNGRYSANVNFSQSAGTSVLTSNGLQSVNIGPIIIPSNALILYDAHSFGFTATATPKRSLTMWASYSKATSSTSSTAVNSYNNTGLYSANIEYHARRLGFSAGFNHFSQSVGAAAGTAPANVNSYFVGINRWFGFF